MYGDKQIAMYYDESTQPYTQLVDVWVAFGLGRSTNPAKIVPLRVYDGTTGVPTTLLGTVNTTMGQIRNDVAGNYYTEFSFVNTPITLPVSKKFFCTIDVTNLNWATNHDTLSIVSNTDGQTIPSAIWEQRSDNTWHQYTTSGSWNLSASLYMHPFLTGTNTQAVFTQTATSICAGSSISFDATGSTFQDTLLWYFPGGSPLTSNTITQSTIYNTPGSYPAILYVVGGGCDLFDSAFVNITVNANPTVAIAASATSVCTGGTTNLTASGATSYAWSPPTGLSSTNTAATVATPPGTITYNVVGTAANGCTGSSTIQIDVLANPVAVAQVNDTTICVGGSVIFDGSNSTDATSFAWTFTGGNPASSNSSSCTVTYGTAGNYTATLVVTNQCGANTVISQTVSVGCTGIDQIALNDPYAFYNADQHQLEVQLPVSSEGYSMTIFDNLGQVVKTVSTKNVKETISTEGFAAGVYTMHVTNSNTSYSMKFVKN
jgi:hypothetical protein